MPNNYEKLYSIKNDLEKSIKQNKIFKLSVDEAVILIFEVVGVLFSLSITLEHEKMQKIIKEYVKTNASEIEDISFFQESLKWIFRWCAIYCEEESSINKGDIVPEEVFQFMGTAYAYEKFIDMWGMHNHKKVKFQKYKNKITFDYNNEENYITHLLYDTYFKKESDAKNRLKIDLFTDLNHNTFEETMSIAHQMDFVCTFNVEFDQFNLDDYKKFSTTLTNLLSENRMKKFNGKNYIINPKKEGYLIYKREIFINDLAHKTKMTKEKIENIISFFTYNFSNPKSDISLSYLVPISDDYIVISEAVFSLSRPEANALRLLAKNKSSNYDAAQNNFEEQERKDIEGNINKDFLLSYGTSKAQKNLPGIDMLVFDPVGRHLQIIELKYKIPVDSTLDIKNLDDMLKKAYQQVEVAKSLTKDRMHTLLEEYFGSEYEKVIPGRIDYFVLTNYSIGTGIGENTPTPILLTDHYKDLMKKRNGMSLVRTVLNSSDKKLPIERRKRHSRFSLLGHKILIPEYSFRLNLSEIEQG
ncbi:hypothetical protein P6709_11715 [Jeotgalibacillus sp. ET6]|uniref:hypothetical protein n=1 Tax=Jeotgalibacillus sp. ET6 TaxID=3037260 RepID=UPI00241867D3|nr:hypothetical protein [Jeotgalibacillus sp. ET6]MDG5472412.1 hypothetical protein [Jeotgalibacillus sp. ET6]